MGFNSAFKGLILLKTPGNGRLNNLNDLVLNELISYSFFAVVQDTSLQLLLLQSSFLFWLHESEVNDVRLCVRKYKDTVYLPQMVVVVSLSYVCCIFII